MARSDGAGLVPTEPRTAATRQTMRPVKMRGEMIMRFGDSGEIDEVWIYDRGAATILTE